MSRESCRLTVNEDRLIKQFIGLVRIGSPSFEEAVFSLKLQNELEKLGLEVENDRTGKDGAGNLFAVLGGKEPSLPPILFCAHMDTVEPAKDIKPRIKVGEICSDGATVLGADNKSAIAAILEVLQLLQSSTLTHGDIEFLFTWGEERSHQGAKRFNASRCRARIGFVPDGEGPVGAIITRAPYYDSLHATFIGKASHAGMAPENGISAVVMASKAISLMDLGRIDNETTANLGLISGGSGVNVIPERVNVIGEARSLDSVKLEKQIEMMRLVMEKSAREMGGQVEVKVKREYEGYWIAEDEPPVRIALRALKSIGLEPRIVSSCGGSDANELNARGMQIIVLGMGGRHLHSAQEVIAISELVKLAELIGALVVESSKK
jgi:tripeptide aminopeptidase